MSADVMDTAACQSRVSHAARRQIIAVVGDGNLDPSTLEQMAEGDEHQKQILAEQIGCCIVDSGFRVQTGGRSGVMEAALKGGRSSSKYREGDTIAILPGDDPADANPYADIVICTGLGHYRNGIVARAAGVIAVGGGAGTLQEVAMAWGADRPVVVMKGVSGYTANMCGQYIDSRGRDKGHLPIQGADTAEHAVQLIVQALSGPCINTGEPVMRIPDAHHDLARGNVMHG